MRTARAATGNEAARVLGAVLFGVIGSSALVFGGILGSYWHPPRWVTGVFLAFASGTLISALSFELFPEAVELAGVGPSAGGLFAGAATFVVINTWLDSRVAAGAGDAAELPAPDLQVGADGAVTAGSFALLFAIFASNFPEALVGAIAMRAAGRSPAFAIGIWSLAAGLLTFAVVVGYAVMSGVGPTALGFALAFAGGAVLASLADTLMPEAFERGRPASALATALGFVIAFVLAEGF